MTITALEALHETVRRELEALQPRLHEAVERGDQPALLGVGSELARILATLEASAADQRRIADAQERIATAAEAPPPSWHIPIKRDAEGFIKEAFAYPLP